MRRIFTYILTIVLFLCCAFSEQLIPQNISYGLLSPVKRNALKDKKELHADMKAIVKEGLIKIELYTPSGEYVGTIEKPEDLTEDLALRFSVENLSIKTVTSVSGLRFD